jgi:fucose permease
MTSDNNRLIIRCCYLGMFIQAMVINLTPLLFIPLKDQLGLTYEQVGRLILINFSTQMVVDLICAALADRVNPKPLIVAANLLAGAGLWVFALASLFFARPYDGLVLGTVVFSVGCGLLEVLLSPIINAVPSQRKSSDMAVLHAFYPIGKVVVIIISALALQALGTRHWRWIMLAWSVFPMANTLGFLLVRLPPFAEEGKRQTLRELVRIPTYLGLLLALFMAGAAELSISQWASAFAEKGLGVSKLAADLAGFSLFGVGMIAGRLWFGIKGEAMDLQRFMLWGALLSALMYLVIALSPWPLLSLIACTPAGLFVSMLWPGTLSLSAARFPMAGASMFALLAAAGDTGAAVMPWGVGAIADRVASGATEISPLFGAVLSPDQLGLRAGLLVATLCPLAMAALLAAIRRMLPSQVSPTKKAPARNALPHDEYSLPS